MSVILIGYRGTGKSSVGKRLAERLRMPFYDTDDLVEAAAGRSIGEIVAEGGWVCFREREKEVIRKLARRQKGVVATGGGAVMDEENADVLKQNGTLIWLEADVETIVQRIRDDSQSREKRPSLLGNELFQETLLMLEQRVPAYRRLAEFSVNTTLMGIDDVVNEIYRFLQITEVSGKDGHVRKFNRRPF
jgi:shikimate kinase